MLPCSKNRSTWPNPNMLLGTSANVTVGGNLLGQTLCPDDEPRPVPSRNHLVGAVRTRPGRDIEHTAARCDAPLEQLLDVRAQRRRRRRVCEGVDVRDPDRSGCLVRGLATSRARASSQVCSCADVSDGFCCSGRQPGRRRGVRQSLAPRRERPRARAASVRATLAGLPRGGGDAGGDRVGRHTYPPPWAAWIRCRASRVCACTAHDGIVFTTWDYRPAPRRGDRGFPDRTLQVS